MGEGARERLRPGGPLSWLHLVVPGSAELREGKRLTGTALVTLWTGFWVILLWRWDRVLAAPERGMEGGLALTTLFLMGVGSLAWSPFRREWRRRREEPDDGPWAPVLRTFRRNRVAVAGAAAVVVLLLVALLAPLLAPYPPAFQGDLLTRRLVGPSSQHLLGTDPFARDILSRLIYGARVSLSIALLAVFIAVTIGTMLGAVAGYLGGKVDILIMRGVDVVLAFPRLVLLITVVALFQPSPTLIVLILGLTQWPVVARIVRGEVLSLREREFILAGRALGFSRSRIIFRHVIPNVLAPVIVAGTLGIGDTIVLEAILSFLGLGVQEPVASWGRMVSGGREHLLGAWWVAAFPGMAIVLAVLAFNLAGDGLRDALDPRLRG
jgi:peptide/nickel transport system permease protein